MKIVRLVIVFIIRMFCSIANTEPLETNKAKSSQYSNGIKLVMKNKFKQASIQFRYALSKHPYSINSIVALKVSDDAIKGKIDQSTALNIFNGISYFGKNNFKPALEMLLAASIDNSQHPIPYFYRGRIHVAQKNYRSAKLMFDKAILLDPDFAIPYFFRGTAYFETTEYKRATSDFAKVAKLLPEWGASYYMQGHVHLKTKKYEKAISSFNKTLQLNANAGISYYSRGRAYEMKKQLKLALNDYSISIRYRPRHSLSYAKRGYLQMIKMGNKLKGCIDFAKACELGSCIFLKWAKNKKYCDYYRSYMKYSIKK